MFLNLSNFWIICLTFNTFWIISQIPLFRAFHQTRRRQFRTSCDQRPIIWTIWTSKRSQNRNGTEFANCDASSPNTLHTTIETINAWHRSRQLLRRSKRKFWIFILILIAFTLLLLELTSVFETLLHFLYFQRPSQPVCWRRRRSSVALEHGPEWKRTPRHGHISGQFFWIR